jgi:hypothetical protein
LTPFGVKRADRLERVEKRVFFRAVTVWCKSLHSIEDRHLGVRDFYASDLRVGLLNRLLQSLLPQEALSCCMASAPDTADLTCNLVTNTGALFYCLLRYSRKRI